MSAHNTVIAKLKDIGTIKYESIDFADPKSFHDRVLLVEGRKFHVQAGLLMVRSEYFQGLFGSNFKEATMEEIEIKDVSAEDFDNFLKLIYNEKLEITVSNYLGLAELADRFLAPRVFEEVKQFIISNFNNLNKIDFLKYAFQHDKKELKDLMAIFIASQFGSENTSLFTCTICEMPFSGQPFCGHTSGCKYPYVNTWIRGNIDQIRELSPEIQCFILSASVGKF